MARYARYHFTAAAAPAMQDALFGLEQNWLGDIGHAPLGWILPLPASSRGERGAREDKTSMLARSHAAAAKPAPRAYQRPRVP